MCPNTTPADTTLDREALKRKVKAMLDDPTSNFIGNRPRVAALLEGIIEWQARHGEPFDFITQASINLGPFLGEATFEDKFTVPGAAK